MLVNYFNFLWHKVNQAIASGDGPYCIEHHLFPLTTLVCVIRKLGIRSPFENLWFFPLKMSVLGSRNVDRTAI